MTEDELDTRMRKAACAPRVPVVSPPIRRLIEAMYSKHPEVGPAMNDILRAGVEPDQVGLAALDFLFSKCHPTPRCGPAAPPHPEPPAIPGRRGLHPERHRD